MGLFDWFRKSNQTDSHEREINLTSPVSKNRQDFEPALIPRKEVDFSLPVTEEEKEIVSVIISAIAAEHYSGRKFRIKTVTRIDTEKEIVAAIVGAIAANDKPDAHFVLRKIERIN